MDVLGSRTRSFGQRISYFAIENHAGIRRRFRKRIFAGNAKPFELFARETDRLYFYGLSRRIRHDRFRFFAVAVFGFDFLRVCYCFSFFKLFRALAGIGLKHESVFVRFYQYCDGYGVGSRCGYSPADDFVRRNGYADADVFFRFGGMRQRKPQCPNRASRRV